MIYWKVEAKVEGGSLDSMQVATLKPLAIEALSRYDHYIIILI